MQRAIKPKTCVNCNELLFKFQPPPVASSRTRLLAACPRVRPLFCSPFPTCNCIEIVFWQALAIPQRLHCAPVVAISCCYFCCLFCYSFVTLDVTRCYFGYKSDWIGGKYPRQVIKSLWLRQSRITGASGGGMHTEAARCEPLSGHMNNGLLIYRSKVSNVPKFSPSRCPLFQLFWLIKLPFVRLKYAWNLPNSFMS